MKTLEIPVNLVSNVTLARIYWELIYSGEGVSLSHLVLDEIKTTYTDEDVLWDFMDSVQKEVRK